MEISNAVFPRVLIPAVASLEINRPLAAILGNAQASLRFIDAGQNAGGGARVELPGRRRRDDMTQRLSESSIDRVAA